MRIAAPRAALALFAFLGRHATTFMAVGVLAGIAVPPLARLLAPLLVPTLLIPFTLALLRLDWSAVTACRRTPWRVLALLLWLMLSGIARAGAAGAARVLAGVSLWAILGVSLLAIYAYRFEVSEIADRVIDELGPPTARNGPAGTVIVVVLMFVRVVVSAKLVRVSKIAPGATGLASIEFGKSYKMMSLNSATPVPPLRLNPDVAGT